MRNKEEVEKIVNGYASSGLSVESYCRKLGIRSNRFYYWRKSLQEQEGERFVKVAGDDATAEITAGNIKIKVPVSAVAEIIRSLACLR